jgi:hypothetical protein
MDHFIVIDLREEQHSNVRNLMCVNSEFSINEMKSMKMNCNSKNMQNKEFEHDEEL